MSEPTDADITYFYDVDEVQAFAREKRRQGNVVHTSKNGIEWSVWWEPRYKPEPAPAQEPEQLNLPINPQPTGSIFANRKRKHAREV